MFDMNDEFTFCQRCGFCQSIAPIASNVNKHSQNDKIYCKHCKYLIMDAKSKTNDIETNLNVSEKSKRNVDSIVSISKLTRKKETNQSQEQQMSLENQSLLKNLSKQMNKKETKSAGKSNNSNELQMNKLIQVSRIEKIDQNKSVKKNATPKLKLLPQKSALNKVQRQKLVTKKFNKISQASSPKSSRKGTKAKNRNVLNKGKSLGNW